MSIQSSGPLPVSATRWTNGEICINLKFEKTMCIYIKPSATVESLVTEFQKKFGKNPPPWERLRLLYSGKQLSEKSRTLASYGIESEVTIYVVLRLYGGFGFNLSSIIDGQIILKDFHTNLPVYRTVQIGLSLLAKCKTRNCIAYNDFVYINKGIGRFNIGLLIDSSKCPVCQQVTTAVTKIGFWNCHYAIEGRMETPELREIEEEGNACKEKYTTFREGAATYTDLVIKTNRIEYHPDGMITIIE